MCHTKEGEQEIEHTTIFNSSSKHPGYFGGLFLMLTFNLDPQAANNEVDANESHYVPRERLLHVEICLKQ